MTLDDTTGGGSNWAPTVGGTQAPDLVSPGTAVPTADAPAPQPAWTPTPAPGAPGAPAEPVTPVTPPASWPPTPPEVPPAPVNPGVPLAPGTELPA